MHLQRNQRKNKEKNSLFCVTQVCCREYRMLTFWWKMENDYFPFYSDRDRTGFSPNIMGLGQGKVQGRAKLQIDKISICKFDHKYYVTQTWI